MTIRKVGVEEEMFLVDPETGHLAEVSDRLVALPGARNAALSQELFLPQVETASDPTANLRDLREDLAARRRAVRDAALQIGAAPVSTGTPVLPDDDPEPTPDRRYQALVSRFGALGRQSLVCGTHVHVDIGDGESVRVLDETRPWLPLVMALASNSPFDHGIDTGYASWRGQMWDGWPSAGPAEPFGDLAGYRDSVARMIASGAALDEGAIYFDARMARSYPTLEIRVADACTDVDDAVLVAELCRGLVEASARGILSRDEDVTWRTELLRAARWRARHDGLSNGLLHPGHGGLVAASEALGVLLSRLGPVLADHGTTAEVEAGLTRLVTGGTGADRQREVAERAGLAAVVDDLIARTA